MEEELDQAKRNYWRQQQRFYFNLMLFLALGSSLAVLLLQMFRWHLVHWVTPFFLPLIELAGLAVFLGTGVATLVYLIVSKQPSRARTGIPFIIQLVTLVLVLTVPFNALAVEWNDRAHRAKRETVVQMVQEDQLQPNVGHNPALIRLPSDYRHLSRGGGEIVVHEIDDNLQVLFFTYRGIIGSMSGFVYSADGSPPDDLAFGITQLLELKQFGPNWYWFSSS
ncbi:hypothetical protein [Paenibacillus daejeonensis]|uniref:hypothetical protein n=1 Tax=Paenibacillus daejeonensis TaxID=135193 RepID=UPI00037FC4EA|nr:hypothetical protein [Paenibacillus daejeonensis]